MIKALIALVGFMITVGVLGISVIIGATTLKRKKR